jgi:RNA polymerase sigma-70 factor (ECF subfamily)
MLQEVWMKIIRHIDKYDMHRDFGKWASAVCVNTFRDIYRKSKKVDIVEFADAGQMEAFFSTLPDESDGIPGRDEYAALYQAIGLLTPRMRTVTVLHYFSGYSEKECAQILGISANKVKSRLYSARQFLKRSLDNEKTI